MLHWKLSGRTLTPVEPSEAMQTLGEGLVNAGFVLFALAIVGTAIFGRFFCGWACHIVALQDLATTVLRRLGVEPRPFRSRLLVWVPFLAAIYMFVLPTLVRLGLGEPLPALRAHFETDAFWSRFPDWPIALLTFVVCGFASVWILGNKGFCTYACPYGGVFGLADRVARGRIRVTDACDGCGHCTVTCTSNVRVHEEVALERMVVDPGCMKCTDCITVCPKGALYYGFGPLPGRERAAASPAKKRPRRYDYTWGEEIAMALVFLVSIVTFRALYDAVPFLLALGLAGITTHLVMTLFRLWHSPRLAFARFTLRKSGRTTRAGGVFAALALAWTVFVAHSAVVQAYALSGAHALGSAQRAGAERKSAARAAAERARRLLERASTLGLFRSGPLEMRLASASVALGATEDAERHYRHALDIDPDLPHARYEVARIEIREGRLDRALEHLRSALKDAPELPGAHEDLADVLIRLGRVNEALDELDALVERRVHHLPFRVTRALVLAHAGRSDEGLALLARIAEEHPEDAAAHYMRGRLLANAGDLADAFEAIGRSLTLRPDFAEAHYTQARLALTLGRPAAVQRHLDRARTLAPFDTAYVAAWAGFLARTGELEAAIAATSRTDDRAARFLLERLLEAREAR